MISVESALNIIKNQQIELSTEVVKLSSALNRCLSNSITSPISFPPFNQSAMDGYAICSSDTDEYQIMGVIQAGMDVSHLQLNKGQAYRIFTGAMVPIGADRVVRQEDVSVIDSKVKIEQMPIEGANIRNVGEQIRLGEILVPERTFLNSGTIGYLAMVGIVEVEVFKLPQLKVLITGDELIQPGEELVPGKIYESNSLLLRSLIESDGMSVEIIRVKDDFESTKKIIEDTLNQCDILLVSGGISVGDYDYVRESLVKNNVEELFYKVKQKPGKPLYFGKKGNVYIFGLPGNPAASYSCYAIYCRTLLAKYCAIQELNFKSSTLGRAYEKKSGLTHFLKAELKEGSVYPTSHQNSSMLKSFVEANCLAIIEESAEELLEGSQIRYIDI